MCDLPSPNTPPKDPETSTAATATCCPAYARFEGPANRLISVNGAQKPAYYAYDDRTDMASDKLNDWGREYWFKTRVGQHPSNRRTRDGASWISVPAGEVAEVEIHMDRKSTTCLKNCEFIVDNASVARAVTTSVTSTKATFQVQGIGRGEATLVVRCGGKDVGWFHIWCERLVALTLNVCSLVGPNSSAVAIDAKAAQNKLNEIFQQALLQFSLIDHGAINMSLAAVATESTAFATAKRFGQLSGTSLWTTSLYRQLLTASFPASWCNARTKSYGYAFYSLKGDRYSELGSGTFTSTAGAVPGIGQRFGVSFNGANYVTLAHEVGHMLGLAHPSGVGGDASGQLAAHLRASLKNPVSAQPKTNTDIAIRSEGAAENVMALDPHNIMGYSEHRSDRSKLRIDQCRACRRG